MLTVSPSPHVHGDFSTQRIMLDVAIALMPAFLVSILYFGMGAIKVTFIAVVACMLFEYLIQKFLLKVPVTVTDGSALVSGILLAFNVPSSIPTWMVVLGALVTIGVAKMSFGGLGKNPFNPALVGRVFLLISFPVDMTNWPRPRLMDFSFADAVSGATALGKLKEGLMMGETVDKLMVDIPGYLDLFIGNVNGSLGEMSAMALLIGAVYLLMRRVISLYIPLSFILSVVILTGIFWLYNPSRYADPLFHILSGGLMLGAWFMATDMVTSPMSKMGMMIFGIGCGLITVLIRLFGAYPEGVSFAILIMNAVVPLINRSCKPKRFGEILK
ncbi:MAG: Na+-transporting NADH:ubiquinone oxidoreductase subunit D [Bdellovibrionales bacterium RIFOXYB1_FULL_37_110]|nr:MAG: Na+-transporting NADH:ubiquinone oxidoreductase subunit D [Bdellovibrionales bacterium RIFOXYA1_FULL_38_20]OFZ52521.1 MAG: Na+-transporting NADH:ubiquinone oxidoreductase subunit D [Bdellovibrionales bacterium RIFOXYC1_FULL_37_79]OFZ59723.1 MAG: Na+-transporting NADH:ubiquinone oxidoreductase subunit D [Bdellovibrionales bacterium RIFOXYB1_FULL_37_110]OFZ62650.1 MAG: Na+-transporting NADH:ubiquinone oxidoreductase subunit D [Bdellovibrionales bacterium RIFOXYD1_FULL_36_51]